MNVIFLSPAFPAEMPLFTRALAACGARVLGVGEGHVDAINRDTRDAMTSYLQVKSLWDEDAVCNEVERWLGGRSVDRVECLWEPGVVLAARLRERLGVRGMSVEHAAHFRDKELMKRKLDAAGIRTPRHFRCSDEASAREAAERLGYPLIVKPIAGAGSADTYRVDDRPGLDETAWAHDGSGADPGEGLNASPVDHRIRGDPGRGIHCRLRQTVRMEVLHDLRKGSIRIVNHHDIPTA